MRRILNNSGVILVLFASAIFVLFQSPLAPGANGVPGVDSSVFLYCASQILEGKLMYTEVFDHKGPFMYVIDVVGITISPSGSYFGVWFLELLSLFGSSVFMFKTLRFGYDKLVSLLAAVSGLLFLIPLLIGGNLTEEWAILPISIALYIFSKFYFKDQYLTKFEILFLSLTFSFTFLLKSNMTIIWVIFGAVIFFSLLMDKNYNDLLKYVLFTFVGLVISFLPFVVYAYNKGILDDGIFCYFTYNSKFFVSWNLSVAFYTFKSLLGFSYLSLIITIYLSYSAVQLIFKSCSTKAEKNVKQFQTGILLSFILSAVACSIGNRHEHYYMMFAPLTGITYAFFYELITRNLLSKNRIVLLILVFLSLNAKNIHSQVKTIRANFNTDMVSGVATPSRSTMDEIIKLINREVNSEGDILVRGNLCSVYLLSDRECSSKYPYRTYFSSEMEEEYLDLIMTRKPKLILSGSIVNDWYINDSFNAAISEKYSFKNTEIIGLDFWVLNEPE